MRKEKRSRERDLFKILYDLFSDFQWIQNGYYSFLCTKNGYPKQIDFYIPSLKLAFEHHGQQHNTFVKFFHKTESGFKKMKQRDREKIRQCKGRGIKLIAVWHYEVLNHQSLINKVREHAPHIYSRLKHRWKGKGYI